MRGLLYESFYAADLCRRFLVLYYYYLKPDRLLPPPDKTMHDTEDAWWQYINKTTGSFTYPASSTPDVAWDMTELPVKARYHDGDQKCVADRNSIYGKKCWGMLMVK